MVTRIIGDIHGKFETYKRITDVKFSTLQLGDFGVGFAGNIWHDAVNEYHASGEHFFIRGNHDDPDRCKKEMVGYIKDGSYDGRVMYIGGAWSIDHMIRIPGVDWWAGEQLSAYELEEMIEQYKDVKPKVMVTHDCPTIVSYYMFVRENKSLGGRQLYLNNTAEAFQDMFDYHQPDQWFFGHWHCSSTRKIKNTTFVCLGECDYIDVDLNDTEKTEIAIKEKFKEDEE